jgi:HSP20 family protein
MANPIKIGEIAMSSGQELQVQEKREAVKRDEDIVPARAYLPTTDIYETPEALVVVMEMPGVDKANLDVRIENDSLSVAGQIDFSKYENLRPVYTEYNIGHYRRSFTISSIIDRDRISADVQNGVLTLTLPKSEAAMPKTIKIG